MNLDQVSPSVRREAQRIVIEQGALGDSPGGHAPDGSAQLCAAACLAVAGARVRMPRRTPTPEDQLGPAGGEALERAFEELGWDVRLCREMRAENDARRGAERTSWFLATLRGSEVVRAT